MDVKLWMAALPSCASARPAQCAACDAPSRESGRALGIVGHGVRARTIEGPLEPDGVPALTEIVSRRYTCRACSAVLVVVPRGIARGYRYSLGAIACALALWAYAHETSASVRARTSTAKTVGASSATRWASLRRWTQCALVLFGMAPGEGGTVRQRAARIAAFIASKAPVVAGPVPLDAFFGAAFCRPL